MQVNELLQSIAEKAGLKDNPDLSMVLGAGALKEVEVPEEVAKQISKQLGYTKEIAKNDQEVEDYYYNKLNGKIYTIFDDIKDQFLHNFGLPSDLKEEINGKDNATQRMKAFLRAVQNAKIVKPDDVKDIEKKYQKEIEDLNGQIKTIRKGQEEEIQAMQRDYQRKNDNFELRQRIFNYNLIDNIPGGKGFLAEAVVHKLRENYNLIKDENGSFVIRDKNDLDKKVFIDNEELTFDKALKSELDPYIKRSEPNRKPDFVNGKPNIEVPANKSEAEMTNAELIRERYKA